MVYTFVDVRRTALFVGIVLFILLIKRKSIELSIISLFGTMVGTVGIMAIMVMILFKC